MSSTRIGWLGVACAIALQCSGTAAYARQPDSAVARAKALYGDASYEEALAMLATVPPEVGGYEADQYRALCLLALDREADAIQTLENIVAGNPLYAMTSTEVSPRLVAMFRDVRRRVLPTRARQLYAEARADYEATRHTEAAARLQTLLRVLDDPDLAEAGADLADLKLVAGGFLKLSEAALRRDTSEPVVATAPGAAAVLGAEPKPAEPKPAEPKPVAPATTGATTGSAPAEVLTVYSARDTGVIAPVAVSRPMPRWNPPNAVVRAVEFRGELEILVDERGNVETATVRVPVSPFYDPALLQAAKEWRFRPALRNGVPVKYWAIVPVVLRP